MASIYEDPRPTYVYRRELRYVGIQAYQMGICFDHEIDRARVHVLCGMHDSAQMSAGSANSYRCKLWSSLNHLRTHAILVIVCRSMWRLQ